MRLYSGSSAELVQDSIRNRIAGRLEDAFFNAYRFRPSPNEVRSWQNSLRALSQVFQEADLLQNGVILEYQLPLTSKRLDCLLTGRDKASAEQAVIVELKQWEQCEAGAGRNEVTTWLGSGLRDVLHPSVQVGQYKHYLQDAHTAFDSENGIGLNACSYLHNYGYNPDDVIFADKFKDALQSHPIFTADDVDPLISFLRARVEAGDYGDVLRAVEQSRYRPSRELLEHVGETIKGKSEYVLLDEQLIVFDRVMATAEQGYRDKRKTVVIVKGGPGTGKSVVALNLLGELSSKHLNTHYVTGSKAFTTTVREIVGTRAAQQVKYFNSYPTAQYNDVDVMVCDEAHRIRATSNNRFTKAKKRSNLPQIAELINAAKTTVFFIDDNQVVRPGEVGSVQYIQDYATKNDCALHEYQLEAQFRCAGSNGFINWINNTLEIERTANVLWRTNDEAYDFKIFSSPQEVEAAIRAKASEGQSARMTAGFCWPWSDPRPNGTLIDDVIIGEYRRPWNAKSDAGRLAPGVPKESLWAYQNGGIDQIGCIYTAQGFEFDYAGVIFGSDLVYRPMDGGWTGAPEKSQDSVVKRSRASFLQNVKNTYRVLLSRGMKGCYVCFLDEPTEHFFRSRQEL